MSNQIGRRTFLGGAAAAAGFAVAGCSSGGKASGSQKKAPAGSSTTSALPNATLPDSAKHLTPEQLCGQRVIWSYSGETPPASLLAAIRAGTVGGVIFFSQNVGSDATVAAAIRSLRAAHQKSPIKAPLLLMTDQEGGEVRRLPGAPTLSEKEIGESSNPGAEAAAAGTGAADNLRGVGMNLNLAPVLDVFYTPGDFDDQYQRSYSNRASVVSTCGEAFIKAQQKAKVAATAKHFPGLGAATKNQDTDVEPVTITVPLEELQAKDEFPYKAAIASGVDLVMVSWAIYTAYDKELPAGLCPRIVLDELRGRLGFRGVTITDALEAGALKNFGTSGQRALKAANAGMDLILASVQNPDEGAEATAALAQAYRKGQLDKAMFNRAYNRVTKLKLKLA